MSDTICAAIHRRAIILFWYDGSKRKVEPHLLGYASNGNLLLSAFQIYGGSGSDWRDFLVSSMSGLSITEEIFQIARQGYNRNDRKFSRVICRI